MAGGTSARVGRRGGPGQHPALWSRDPSEVGDLGPLKWARSPGVQDRSSSARRRPPLGPQVHSGAGGRSYKAPAGLVLGVRSPGFAPAASHAVSRPFQGHNLPRAQEHLRRPFSGAESCSSGTLSSGLSVATDVQDPAPLCLAPCLAPPSGERSRL